MPDSADADRELDTAIARLVTAAGADAPAAPDVATFTATGMSGPSPRSRATLLVTVAAIGLVVAAAGTLVFVVFDDDSTGTLRPAGTAPTPTPSTAATTRVETSPSTTGPGTTAPTVAASVEPSDSTIVDVTSQEGGITRPLVAAEVCEPVSAREGITEGITLFARSSANPIPIQVIGDPVDGPTAPFALVQRSFGDGRPPIGHEVVDINGTQVWISVFDSGNGEVVWNLADASQGYLRSRGLDRDALVGIVTALTPRAPSDPIPGFDYDPDDGTGAGLQLLHEQMNTDVAGQVSGSECHVAASDYVYRISAIRGDPVFQYGGVIDRPAPLDVGIRNGTLIVINGLADPSAPTVDDVVDADPTTWLDVRSRLGPLAEGDPIVSTISEGADVVVALVPIDPSTTATSYLTLRLDTQQGVTFLEVYRADAVLASDAAFWRTDINPGGGGISTARVGGVMGFRIGDAPVVDPIDVTIEVIDGGGFVLQTTGPIQLVPLMPPP